MSVARTVLLVAVVGAVIYGAYYLWQEYKRKQSQARYAALGAGMESARNRALGLGTSAVPPTVGVMVDEIDPSLIGMEENVRSRLIP